MDRQTNWHISIRKAHLKAQGSQHKKPYRKQNTEVLSSCCVIQVYHLVKKKVCQARKPKDLNCRKISDYKCEAGWQTKSFLCNVHAVKRTQESHTGFLPVYWYWIYNVYLYSFIWITLTQLTKWYLFSILI